MATSDAPISIGAVTLRVKNLSAVAAYYEDVIGLNRVAEEQHTVSLGVGNNELLYLQEDSAAKRRPTETGLFHTAFLLPRREDLGSWLKYVADQRIVVDGASDHRVSEAVYLHDPEGNGIEVYADRNRSAWVTQDSQLSIQSRELDARGLMASAEKTWSAAPDGTVIGHVHLQVADLESTDDFYCNEIGFDKMKDMQQARFYGSGGYHHHIAGNTWNRPQERKHSPASTGLVQVDLLTNDARRNRQVFTDPCGITVTIAPSSSAFDSTVMSGASDTLH